MIRTGEEGAGERESGGAGEREIWRVVGGGTSES